MYHNAWVYLVSKFICSAAKFSFSGVGRIYKPAIVSNSFILSIASDIAPNITTYTPYITVLNGSSVTLTCILHEGGLPAATIKWMFSDIVISTSSKYTITDSDNSTQININIANTSDAGIYYCQANNLAGSSTAVIALDVQSKNLCNLSDFYYMHK